MPPAPSGSARQAAMRRAASRSCSASSAMPAQCPSKAISTWLSMPSAASFFRPPSSGRSMMKVAPTISPPERLTSLAAASAVPPVAIRSSTIRMRSPLADGVLVHLDDVDAVFQRVLLADGLPGQLALLAQGHEPAAQPVGDGAAEDEPARLDAGHRLHLGVRIGRRHPLDRRLEALGVAEQRGDVPEHDALLGIVRDGADQAFQVWHGLASHSCRRTIASGRPAVIPASLARLA